MIARLWTYLHQSPGWTWIGHALQGFWWGVASGFFAFPVGVAWAVLVFHFSIREGEGIVRAYQKGDRAMLLDGVMDLLTPFLGLLVYILLNL